jgi:hypothetical protein
MSDQAVLVYEHTNYGGKRVAFTEGRYLGDKVSKSIGNDTISSLKVPEGLQIEVFEHSHGGGKSLVFYEGDYSNLDDYGWNDMISALEVKEAPHVEFVTVYKHTNYEGSYQLFPVSPEVKGVAFNDAISSVKVPASVTATLYEHHEGAGNPLVLTESAENLELMGFNDICSSIKVSRRCKLVDVLYHYDRINWGESTKLATIEQIIKNNSKTAKIVAPVSYSETVGWEISNTWDHSLMVGAEITVETSVGVPGVSETNVSVTLKTEYTHSWGHEETSSGETTLEGGIEVEVPENSGTVIASITIYRKNYTIPYTAKLVDPITGIQLPDETGFMTVKNVFYVEAEVKDGRIETKRKKQNKVKKTN